LKPGSTCELDLQDNRFTDKGVEGVWSDVSHASRAGVCICVNRVCGEKAVEVATGFKTTTARNFPAPIAVSAVIQKDLVEVFVVIQAWPVSTEFR
jgi:hypothetical protein